MPNVIWPGILLLQLYKQVFTVALCEVGRLWETNRISVATEHITTAITEGILNGYFEQIISKKRLNRKVEVACVENKQHQVGGKMVADTFEMNGWDSFFLGPGIPLAELIRTFHEEPYLITISLTVYFNFANFIKMINKFREEFPDLQIIIGGQAIKHVSVEKFSHFESVLLLTDLYLIEKFIQFSIPK